MTTPTKKDPWYQKPGPKYKRRTILTTAALHQFQPILVPQQVALDNLVMEENVTVDPFTGVVTVSGVFGHVMRLNDYSGDFEVWSPNSKMLEIIRPQISYTHILANVVKRQSDNHPTGRCIFPTNVRNELIGKLLSAQFDPVLVEIDVNKALYNALPRHQSTNRAYLYDKDADFNPLINSNQRLSAVLDNQNQLMLYVINDTGSKLMLTRYQYRFIPNYDNALAVDLITLHENFENGKAFKQPLLRQPDGRATDTCLVDGHITLTVCHEFKARMYPYNRYHLKAFDAEDMKTNYVVGETYSIGECFGFYDERNMDKYMVDDHTVDGRLNLVAPAEYIARPKDKLYDTITQYYRSKGYTDRYTSDNAYTYRNYMVSDFNNFRVLNDTFQWLMVDKDSNDGKVELIYGKDGLWGWVSESSAFDHQTTKKLLTATHIGIFGKYELVDNTDYRAQLLAMIELPPIDNRPYRKNDNNDDFSVYGDHWGRVTFKDTNKILYLPGNLWKQQPYKSTSIFTMTSNEDTDPDTPIQELLNVPYFQPPTREEWKADHGYPTKLWGDEYWETFKKFYFDAIKRPVKYDRSDRRYKLIYQSNGREYTTFTENDNYNHRKPFWMHFEKVGDKYLFPFGVLDKVWEEGKYPTGNTKDINKEWTKTKDAKDLEADFTELVRGSLGVVDSLRRGDYLRNDASRVSKRDAHLLSRWYNFRLIIDTFLPDADLGDLNVPMDHYNPENKETIYQSSQVSKGAIYAAWYSDNIVNTIIPYSTTHHELQLAGLNPADLDKEKLQNYYLFGQVGVSNRSMYTSDGDSILNKDDNYEISEFVSSEYTFEKYSMLEFLGVAMMADYVQIEIDGEKFDLPGAALVPNPKRIIDYFFRDRHILNRRHNGNNWDNEFVEHLVKRHDPFGWISKDMNRYWYASTSELLSLSDPKQNMNQYIHQHPYEKEAWNAIGRNTEIKIDIDNYTTSDPFGINNFDYNNDTYDIRYNGVKPSKTLRGDTSYLNDYFPRLIECLDIAVPHVYGAVSDGSLSDMVVPADGEPVNRLYSRSTCAGHQRNARYVHKLIHTDFGVNIFEGDIENKSKPLRQQLPEGEYYDTIARLASHFPVRGKKMTIKFLWSKPYGTNLIFTFPYRSSEKQMWVPPTGAIYPDRTYSKYWGDISYTDGEDDVDPGDSYDQGYDSYTNTSKLF